MNCNIRGVLLRALAVILLAVPATAQTYLSLAPPTAGTLGGVKSATSTSNMMSGIDTSGNPVFSPGKIAFSVANNTELSALNSTAVPSGYGVQRLGVAAVGDSPTVVFTVSNSACSLNSGAGDGGSQVPTSDLKCWIGSYPDVVTATAFAGVDPTGATYSTTGIANALAASVTAGVPLSFPCGTYRLNGGAGGFVFEVANAPLYLIGEAKGCVVFDLRDVSSGAVIFYQALNNVKVARSVIINLSNGSVYGTLYNGGGEFYRVQGAGTGELSGLIMKDNTIYNYPNLSASFRGLSSTPDGVLSNSIISDNVLTGIYGYYWGDHVVVANNIFYADPTTGVESVQVAGSANLMVIGNTCAGPGGCVLLHNGINPIIDSNEVESNTHNTTLPNNGYDSLIDVAGDFSPVISPQITNNSISLGVNGAVGVGTASTTSPIRIDYSEHAVVDGGRIGVGSSANPHITVTTHAVAYNIDSKKISYENPLGIASLGNDVLSGVGSAINPSFGSGFCSNGSVTVSGAQTDSFVINIGTGTCSSSGAITMPPSKFGTGWNCKAFILNSPNHVIIEGSTTSSSATFYDYTVGNVAQNFPTSSALNVTCSAY